MNLPETDDRLLLLSPEDNILVARAPIAAGERVLVAGGEIVLAVAIGMGHKLARHDILAGDSIVKYGAVIGTATRNIPRGWHVHLHNVKSNYTATHSLEEARAAHGPDKEVRP